jgi:hypothetical protein
LLEAQVRPVSGGHQAISERSFRGGMEDRACGVIVDRKRIESALGVGHRHRHIGADGGPPTARMRRAGDD